MRTREKEGNCNKSDMQPSKENARGRQVQVCIHAPTHTHTLTHKNTCIG